MLELFLNFADLQKVELSKQAEALIPWLNAAKSPDFSVEVFNELVGLTLDIKDRVDKFPTHEKGNIWKKST